MFCLNDFIQLFSDRSVLESRPFENPQIDYISYNSRDIKENTLFFCKGAHFKEEFLCDAVKKGAVAYVSEKEYPVGAPCIKVSDMRLCLALAADFFYGSAYKKLKLIGITGTKGKSTTAYFIKYIVDEYLKSSGKRCAIVSSIDTFDGVVNEESSLTTPEPFELHRHFANAVKSETEYFVMEVSSQALKYGRVYGVEFMTGCYLNIGIDHISAVEHPNFEDYFLSKMKLFSQSRAAVLNLNSDKIDEVLRYAANAGRVITFGTKNENADYYGFDIRKKGSRTVFSVKSEKINGDFTLGIPGLFNVENALCAIAVCADMGIDEDSIREGLSKARTRGRMEIYESADKKIAVIVDYAHNKMSFENLFSSVKREYPGRKISIVFGCPGDKAVVRRKDLGYISAENADMSYITEDDPATESLDAICRTVASYIEEKGGKYRIIHDRGEAIREAVRDCRGECVVLLAGKGSETHQKRANGPADYLSDAFYAKKYLDEYDRGMYGVQDEK